VSDPKRPDHYEPPEVEKIPSGDGPVLTAAGDSPPQDDVPGVEWRPRDPDS
jgi:hypothetical protein